MTDLLRPRLFVPSRDEFDLSPRKSLPKLDINAPIPQHVVKPANTKRIRFADGKVVALNRRQRRANKIYNRDLKQEK